MATKPLDFSLQVQRCKAHTHQLMAITEYLLSLYKTGATLVQLHDWCWDEEVGLVAEVIQDSTQAEAKNMVTHTPELFALWMTTEGRDAYFRKLYTERISLSENKNRLRHCGFRFIKADSVTAQVTEELQAQPFDGTKEQVGKTVILETGDSLKLVF